MYVFFKINTKVIKIPSWLTFKYELTYRIDNKIFCFFNKISYICSGFTVKHGKAFGRKPFFVRVNQDFK
jgi:hypothetical protein